MLTAVERVLILKRADLLAGVRPRHLLGLAHLAQEIEIARGQTLYREEDTADVLYLVVEGRVRLSTGERTTSEVGPGEAFGTWALVDDARRGQSAVALEDGLVLSLRRSDFYEEAAGDVTLLQEVIRVLARRLRALVTDRPEEARVEPEGQPADEPEPKGEAPRSA
jgi:CRP/FNR family cyclic AMP-dependent transcriptional regulator